MVPYNLSDIKPCHTMLYIAILTALIGAFTLVNASPIANATSILVPRNLRGGYYNDPQCYLKGYFSPRSSPYGLYDGAQCPPPGSDPYRVYATLLDLNNCLLNQDGQLKWLAQQVGPTTLPFCLLF